MKRLAVALVCVLACGVGYYSLLRLNRPLFHDNFDWYKESLTPRWYPNSSLLDQHGNFAYFDFHDDLVVLIATDGTVRRNTTPLPTINSSRLLHDTPFEAIVEKQQNILLVIDRDGGRTQHNLKRGLARKLRVKFRHIHPSGNDLRDSILGELDRGKPPPKDAG